MQDQSRRTSLASLFAAPSDDDEPALDIESREFSSSSVSPGNTHPRLNLLPRVGEIPDESLSRSRTNEPIAEHESLPRWKPFSNHRQLSDIFPGIGQPGFKSTQSLPAGNGRETSSRPPLPFSMQSLMSSASEATQVILIEMRICPYVL